jgi:hypothetical protein
MKPTGNNSTTKPITKPALIKMLAGIPIDSHKATVCAIIGHSRIVEESWGYIHCGRCEAKVGDVLGGSFDISKCVVIGHGCDICRALYKKLDWHDKFLAQNPFPKEKKAHENGTRSSAPRRRRARTRSQARA